MVRAKNYEIMSTFVKVIQKKLWPLFFRTRCSCGWPCCHSDLWIACDQVRVAGCPALRTAVHNLTGCQCWPYLHAITHSMYSDVSLGLDL